MFEAIQAKQQQEQKKLATEIDKSAMSLPLKESHSSPVASGSTSTSPQREPIDSSGKQQTAGKPSSGNSPPKKADTKTDPDIGIWVTSYGVYYFKFSQLQPQLQCLHSMLKELFRVPDLDAYHNLMICLRTLILNGDCLETANKEQKGFLIYCLEKLLIPSLWRLLSADYCHLNEIAVSLLVHALVYESGQSTLWSLIERDFGDASWKIRMQAG
jgi:hypothetical protein